MPDSAVATEAGTRAVGRIVGLDIARAFAIVGMVIVNFKITMSAEAAGPDWMRTTAALLDGRAAATFVILAGVGASLGTRRARQGSDATEQRTARTTLAKRAVFLFVLGWAFYPVWPADILHFYGVYLAIGATVLFASGRQLLMLAGVAVAASLVFVVALDPFENWNLEDYSYRGITSPIGFIRNLFFDGFHPVFPWVAFYLFGMWLGRTDLRNPVWRRAMAIWAAAIVVFVEAVAWLVVGPKGSIPSHLDDQSWRWLFSVEPIPPLPLYLAAGAGTAVLVVLGSIWLGERLPNIVAEPLVSTGQLALTIYLAHVFVGMGILEAMGRLESESLGWAIVSSLVFSSAAMVFALLWRRRYERGPLEWVMRRLAG